MFSLLSLCPATCRWFGPKKKYTSGLGNFVSKHMYWLRQEAGEHAGEEMRALYGIMDVLDIELPRREGGPNQVTETHAHSWL